MPAVTTDAQVANQALGFVGHRATINSLLEDSEQAIAASIHFATAKARVLEAFPWRWATKRQALAQLSGVTRDGWAYVHAAPADLLSVNSARKIEDGARQSTDPLPFTVELNDSGSGFVVASDVPTPTLVYTRDVPVALWPAHAVDALVAELAVRLALTLPVKPELAVRLQPLAELRLRQAMAVTANGEVRDPEPDPPAIRARK